MSTKGRVKVGGASTCVDSSVPYSTITRRERSRKLAQKRRDTYKHIMEDLTGVCVVCVCVHMCKGALLHPNHLCAIPYSRKIWRGIKFGGLAVCLRTAKLKSAKFFRVHVRMAILYHTAKFNSNNGVKNVVLGQTAKFNDRQYFRLYGITD